MRARRLTHVGGALATAFAATLLTSHAAGAHAILVTAQPAPGSVLGTPPGAVVLVFDQQLNTSLSQASVTDPSGRTVSAPPVSPFEIRVDLVTALPGTYRVVWTSVSVLDGHTLTGAFDFAVQSSAAAGAATGAPASSAVSVLIAGLRWMEDVALLLALGMIVVEWLGSRAPPLGWVRMRLEPVVVVAVAAGAALVFTEALTASGGRMAGAVSFFTSTSAGQLRAGRVALEVGTAAYVIIPALRSRPPRVAVGALLIAALVDIAASGHAAAVDPSWWGIGVEAAHLAAAAVWVGGIVALVSLHPPTGWRRDGRALLQRFTPWALGGFAATVAFGLLEAAQSLGSVGALMTTAYGRALLVKMGGIGAMVPLSVLAWRWRRPLLRVETVIAAGVVAAASAIAAFPTPASVAKGAALAASIPAATAGLPTSGEVTMAGNAGQILVGLSLAPGRPGLNRVIAYVLPIEGGAAAASLRVTATLGPTVLPLRGCGDTCRSGTASLAGGESLAVSVAGATGGVAHFTIPHLPPPAAQALVQRARAAMAGLRSVALHETLTGGAGVTLVTDYRELAPDVLEWVQPNGAMSITIGTTRYLRSSSGAAWTVDADAPLTHAPLFSWTYFTETRNACSVGSDVIDGVPVDVVSFFSGVPGTPIWFTFAVDARGLVHRVVMVAPGHFMTQTFSSYNASFDIRPPM